MVHPPDQVIGEHRHEWPFLMLPMLGDYVERYDGSEARIVGPSAVLHPAGTCHANCIGDHGMETVSIEFDQDWVRSVHFDPALERSRSWIGGRIGASARALASTWGNTLLTETEVAEATAAFLQLALAHDGQAQPAWLSDVLKLIDGEKSPSTAEIAHRLGLHPAWLARSYRYATGEGLHETIRRNRVERAIVLLRSTETPTVEIALATGFCDQSHMNRVFKAVAGRTPREIRTEQTLLARFR